MAALRPRGRRQWRCSGADWWLARRICARMTVEVSLRTAVTVEGRVRATATYSPNGSVPRCAAASGGVTVSDTGRQRVMASATCGCFQPWKVEAEGGRVSAA
ncbi:hypothetical protein SESBI_00148 [Sesbania bispinosa]|nr:hypothetical protein SESBI_00148 [Sesbania bispinosa]